MYASSIWFTFYRPNFHIHHIIKSDSEWSIVYIQVSQVIISKNIIFLSLSFENSGDPDEMLHFGAFHLGLHC